jgi:hypothetical protein
MRSPRASILAFVLVVNGVAVGCDGGTHYSASGKEAACEEQCEWLHECDDSVKTDACAESCSENKAISKEGQEAITACLKEQECDSQNPVQVIDCVDDDLGALEPSADGQTLCNEALDELAKCGKTKLKDADRADCLDSISVVADNVVSDVSDCALERESCESKQICAFAVLADLLPGDSSNPLEETLRDLIQQLIGQEGGAGE